MEATNIYGIPLEWESLPEEERKRRVQVREATSLMMQGSIIINDPNLMGVS